MRYDQPSGHHVDAVVVVHLNFPVAGAKSRLLDKAVVVENTTGNVQIVREFDARSLSVGLFDFDGTISDERVGWPNLAVANNVAYLIALTWLSLRSQSDNTHSCD